LAKRQNISVASGGDSPYYFKSGKERNENTGFCIIIGSPLPGGFFVNSIEGLLITVRTAKQGAAMEKGKFSEEYRKEISMLNVHPEDIAALGLKDDMQAVLQSDDDEIRVTCRESLGPKGLFFLPLGQEANRLIGRETLGTGVPDYKGIPVRLRAAQTADKE
jgi:formylmethanofuran dehydrogenase subunit D